MSLRTPELGTLERNMLPIIDMDCLLTKLKFLPSRYDRA